MADNKFIKLVYGTLTGYGINTEKMSVNDAVKKFYEIKKQEKKELETPENIKRKLNGEEPIKNTNDDFNNLIGKEFKGYKGQKAINKLLKEKQGYIKGAFYRDDIGNIDLFWGNDNFGLQHIIKHREIQGINSKEFLNNIAEVVEQGNYRKKNEKGNFEFYYKNKIAIISPKLMGNKITFLLTAYKTRYKK